MTGRAARWWTVVFWLCWAMLVLNYVGGAVYVSVR